MTYHRPDTLAKALTLCADPGMRLIAGGTDIYPAVQGRDLPGDFLDLTAIGELSGIHRTRDGWRIGATTCWSEIQTADLPPAFDALKQAARQVGSVQIQNSGTVAGNLCNASPAADGVPPLLALDARIELTSGRGARHLPLSEFLQGVRETALMPDEIVTSIHIPAASDVGQSAFCKLGARKYLVISIAMVAVRLELSDGHIAAAAIAVGACSPVAKRLTGLEAALTGKSPNQPAQWQDQLHRDITKYLSPIKDIRADASYRIDAVATLLDSAIKQAGAV